MVVTGLEKLLPEDFVVVACAFWPLNKGKSMIYVHYLAARPLYEFFGYMYMLFVRLRLQVDVLDNLIQIDLNTITIS